MPEIWEKIDSKAPIIFWLLREKIRLCSECRVLQLIGPLLRDVMASLEEESHTESHTAKMVREAPQLNLLK